MLSCFKPCASLMLGLGVGVGSCVQLLAEESATRAPVDWGAGYEWSANAMLQGDARGHTHGAGMLDLNLTFDTAALFGHEGGTLFAQYCWRHGPVSTEVVGDLQTFSNLDAAPFNKVYELWYEQRWSGDRFRLKVGQIDANTEFAFVEAAGEFTQSSAGFSPTIRLPTYPDPVLAAAAFVRTAGGVQCGAGVFGATLQEPLRASLRDPFWIAEISAPLHALGASADGRVAAGWWSDAGTLDRFDGGRQDGVSGWYALGEWRVWPAPAQDEEGASGLTVFAQLGGVDEHVSAMRRHVALGATLAGVIPGRSDDVFGLYWTRVATSRDPAAGFTADETAVEFFYVASISTHLTLKPGAQWIQHPGGVAARADAVIVYLRTAISF